MLERGCRSHACTGEFGWIEEFAANPRQSWTGWDSHQAFNSGLSQASVPQTTPFRCTSGLSLVVGFLVFRVG
jgi:hypothetical protein